MMAFVEQEFGGADVLVNNAGIQHTASISDFPADKWDAILAINLSSCFHTTRLALPVMRRKNWGRIVNLASVHGLVASVHKAAYVAAKHGLVGFTKVTALETALEPITCNAICPGWVLTPLVQKQIDARGQADGTDAATTIKNMLSEKQPSQAFIRPEDIGAMAVFLCSSAADNIRGQSLAMDGGWTAQ
jgi:3-hydroxybutyrate dehydrogenase